MSSQILSPAPAAALSVAHPMDTSRVLLSLLELARDSGQRALDPELEDDWIVSPWTLRRLLSALSFRDESTMHHSRRVALLSVGIAQHLGWNEDQLRQIEIAALLHDLGKLGIPNHILHKPGRLSPDEQEFVMLHHYIGVDLLQACRIDQDIVDMIWHAHTQGRMTSEAEGEGLTSMPQGARLLAVADAYDSLRNDQPFRRGKSHEETMRLMNEQSGKQYDRNVVAALNRWIRDEGQSFLVDPSGGSLSANLSAPVDDATVRDAMAMCQMFGFLYLLESVYNGFCLIDSDLRFAVWSHGMSNLTGVSTDQVIGENWSRKLLSFTDLKKKPLTERTCPVQLALSSAEISCQRLMLEHRRTRKWHEVELQSLPLCDASGRPQGVALILRSTTQVKGNQGQYRELQMQARRDPLTGVGNRGELEARLTRMLAARAEHKGDLPFSVIFFDLDKFKPVNDTYGHGVGDRVLINLARLVSDELYSGETICRYGGEEFVILCPETDLQQAIQRAERLRRTVEEAQLATPVELTVTASFGVAQIEDGDNMESLLERADQALYDAKRGGRNRTCSRTAQPRRRSSGEGGETQEKPFTHTAELQARVAADMVHYKLSGFVDDNGVRLKKVSRERIEMHLGVPSFLGRWGKTADKQPVRLVLEIGEPQQIGRWASQQVTIRAIVTPQGSCRSNDVFQARAAQVVQNLRAYFAAD
jgi:diguanylate cyclase (GGDEF)-like protein/putative nucleotidyltransferase with HDIG domain